MQNCAGLQDNIAQYSYIAGGYYESDTSERKFSYFRFYMSNNRNSVEYVIRREPVFKKFNSTSATKELITQLIYKIRAISYHVTQTC